MTERIVPQKDRLYAVPLSYLDFVDTGYDEEEEKHEFVKEQNFYYKLNNGENIKNLYTLVKYQGNGTFEEYYSGNNAFLSVTIFQGEEPPVGLFANFSDDNLFKFKNEQDMKAKIAYFKQTPMTVDPVELLEVTPEILKGINDNSVLGDSIRTYIEYMKNYSIKEIEKMEANILKDKKTI